MTAISAIKACLGSDKVRQDELKDRSNAYRVLDGYIVPYIKLSVGLYACISAIEAHAYDVSLNDPIALREYTIFLSTYIMLEGLDDLSDAWASNRAKICCCSSSCSSCCSAENPEVEVLAPRFPKVRVAQGAVVLVQLTYAVIGFEKARLVASNERRESADFFAPGCGVFDDSCEFLANDYRLFAVLVLLNMFQNIYEVIFPHVFFD